MGDLSLSGELRSFPKENFGTGRDKRFPITQCIIGLCSLATQSIEIERNIEFLRRLQNEEAVEF